MPFVVIGCLVLFSLTVPFMPFLAPFVFYGAITLGFGVPFALLRQRGFERALRKKLPWSNAQGPTVSTSQSARIVP
jgi:hypothetical protein